MTVHLSIGLPEWVYERLHEAGRATSRSVRDVILDALSYSDLAPPPFERMTPQERLNWALREVGSPLSRAEAEELAGMFGPEEGLPELTNEELRAMFPPLDLPLSQSIIDDREDRS